MSDFDTVLERLVTDPAFASALAADPTAALAGYRLRPDEVELLRSQVGADTAGQHTVEVRANQSSLFGLLSPVVGMAGALPGPHHQAITDAHAGVGGLEHPPLTSDGIGAAPASGQGGGVAAGFHQGIGQVNAVTGIGPAGATQLGPAAGTTGLGPAGQVDSVAFGSVERFGPGDPGSSAGAPAEAGLGAGRAEPPVPEGYRTRVDSDGDGRWDRHWLRGRADGGVDIMVDRDRDGRADFIGHDRDADGLVEYAEYDKNHDGVFEKRMYDDGDGWMDRTVR